MNKLMYCATPSRLAHKTDEIMQLVREMGYVPLHPFKALPYEFFEGDPKVGREFTMKCCYRLIDTCDDFGMFGVSEGTLGEIIHARERIIMPIHIDLRFDPNWQEFYQKLAKQFGNPFASLK